MPYGSEGLIAGIIEVKINGEVQQAKGNWTYNLGKPKVEPVLGADNSVHGFMGKTQAARIEGEITDRQDLDMEALVQLRGATVTLSLSNEKVIVLKGAAYTGDGDAQTEEGNIQAVFHGTSAEEVR